MANENPAGPLSLLIVDDEKYHQELLQDRLKNLPGWSLEIHCADSGEEGLRKLRGAFYDLIFVDYRLPGANGLAVLDQIRQLHPKSAVIMITGQGNEQVAVSAMKKGAIDYLTKEDLYTQDLSHILRRVVELRYLVDQNMELRQVNQMKNDFIANVSHELRTPLSVIMGYAQTLKGGSLGALSAPQTKAVESIILRSQDLIRILNQLLRFREAREKKESPAFRPVELGALLSKIAAEPPAEGTRKKMALKVSLARREVWVQADPERLGEALASLLSNACKFGPEKSAVRLSLAVKAEEAVVSVADQGAGLAPEMLPRIFEQFSATVKGPTREHGGLGLGLPLAKRIVEEHGGRIWLESAPDNGCSAFIALPLTAPASPAKEGKGAAPFKNRVLLVEDNPDVVDLLMLLLSGLRPSLEVSMARSGFEALERVKDSSPDLIVLDVMMPGMSGFEVIERLRKVPETSRIPVMVLTGYSEAAQKAQAMGVQEVLLKPFDKDVFVSMLTRLLKLAPEKT